MKLEPWVDKYNKLNKILDFQLSKHLKLLQNLMSIKIDWVPLLKSNKPINNAFKNYLVKMLLLANRFEFLNKT